MKTTKLFFSGALVMMLAVLGSCKSHYQVASVERSRMVVDARYDAQTDPEVVAFLKPYKQVVDSIMGPVVGRAARNMSAERPESTLSNLLCDILVWAGEIYGEKPDFGLHNMGGIRADLTRGDVTIGDVTDIAPFENKIAFGTLKGSEVMELFQQIASTGGEGVSKEVRLVITKDNQLLSATLDGQSIDPNRDYRLVTIDYLLGGTDKLEALKKCRNINSPQESTNNTRYIFMDYFRYMTKQGREVDAQIEGRITIQGVKD